MLNRTCIYDLLYHHWTVEIPFLTALLRLPALRAGPCTYRCWGGGGCCWAAARLREQQVKGPLHRPNVSFQPDYDFTGTNSND